VRKPRRLLLLVLLAFTRVGAEVELSGHLTQGGLMIGTAPPGSEVLLDEESILVAEDGRFLLGFGRDTEGPHRLTVRLPDDRVWTQDLRPAPRSFDIQRIDGLPSEKVTPRPEVLERIREEAALARQARTRRDARIDWDRGFIRPLAGRITGVYGSQRILNGQPRAPHWGLDIAAPTGTAVQAPAGGIVTLVHSDMYFSGGTLFVDHGHGLVSAFLHLSDILVEPGQHVAQGEVIAEVGASGRATGPHLDWRISLGDVRIDPALLLENVDE
jgi:murein DD-endopeptidase MepM/ murein hydrolase activator NlpD